MAVQTIHHPPTEGWHPVMMTQDCQCNPRRTTVHKIRSSRQGHDVTAHYWHNAMEKPQGPGEPS